MLIINIKILIKIIIIKSLNILYHKIKQIINK